MSVHDELWIAWRKSFGPSDRKLFLIPDFLVMMAAINDRSAKGRPVSQQLYDYLAWGYDLADILNNLDPAAYAIHPTLVAKDKPFKWSAAPGITGVGSLWHPLLPPVDADQIGMEFSDATGQYELLQIVRGETDIAKASADPRLFRLGPMVPFWFQVA